MSTLSDLDSAALADELSAAYAARRTDVVPPSSRHSAFDLAAGHAVEAELVRRRRQSGRTTVGRKVGFANKALWRVLKIDTVVWASMYDDTVRFANTNVADLSVVPMCAPKIEPEIVLKISATAEALKSGAPLDAAGVLAEVEWIALGFEIIDCVYVDWKFQPADFVASYGLHAGLVVGDPLPVTPDNAATLVDHLSAFTIALARDGQVVAEGSGRNSLRSPALCLAELGSAVARRPSAEPLQPGELVSSGTLTESQYLKAGETWTATVDGIALPALTLRVVG